MNEHLQQNVVGNLGCKRGYTEMMSTANSSVEIVNSASLGYGSYGPYGLVDPNGYQNQLLLQSKLQLEYLRMQTLEQIVQIQQALLSQNQKTAPWGVGFGGGNMNAPFTMSAPFGNEGGGDTTEEFSGHVLNQHSEFVSNGKPSKSTLDAIGAPVELKGDEVSESEDSKKGKAFKPRLCTIDGCTTQAKYMGLCSKHGGKHPCAYHGCEKKVAGTRFCNLHGGTRKKTCTIQGCTKGDQGLGFCAAHGGGKKCSFEGCAKRAVGQGRCWAHNGGKRCLTKGCRKAPRRNGLCKLHGTDDELSSELQNFSCGDSYLSFDKFNDECNSRSESPCESTSSEHCAKRARQ